MLAKAVFNVSRRLATWPRTWAEPTCAKAMVAITATQHFFILPTLSHLPRPSAGRRLVPSDARKLDGMSAFPARTEAADYYFRYIDLVPEGDICATLRAQAVDTLALLRGVSDEQSLQRYAPDKWTVRELLNHINDTERLFVARAFWFARGFDSPLPSFDQLVAATAAEADTRAWSTHVEEFTTIRAATLTFFENLPADAWMRRASQATIRLRFERSLTWRRDT